MGGGRTIEAGWGDDDDDPLGGGFDLSRGGSMASHESGPSAYAGGSIGFGDDDPFADDAPQGALELDVPASHTANTPRSMAVADRSTPARPAGLEPPHAQGGVPDLDFGSKPQPTSNPAMQAVHPSGSMQAVRPSSGSMQAVRPSGSMQAVHAPVPTPPGSNPALPVPPASDPALRAQSQPDMQAQPPPAPAPPRPPDPASMIARFPAPPDAIWESPIYAMKVLWRQFELRQDLASLRKRRSPDVPLYERALKTHDAKTFALGLIITCAALSIASFIFFLPVILRFLRAPE
jgi:hypothetical protein